jgi:hypothetical protein
VLHRPADDQYGGPSQRILGNMTGGHIRDLRLRRSRPRDEDSGQLVDIGETAGRRILLDQRILPRMPSMIPVTVGGIGPFRGLHLGFSGEVWARLLYDPGP